LTKKAKGSPRLGKELSADEIKQDPGLEGSTLIEDKAPGGEKMEDLLREDGTVGWSCIVCTYVNLMDHGRCGESCWSEIVDLLCSDMCQARPDGHLPQDAEFLSS
jgi:hypothetical protein